MSKTKKTKKENVVLEIDTARNGSLMEQTQELKPLNEVQISQKKYEECEWCFQFDDDEPQIFAWTDELLNQQEDPKIVFTITNIENSYITFTNGKSGKVFKIFARELSDEGMAMREKQREAVKNSKTDLENASENKEA